MGLTSVYLSSIGDLRKPHYWSHGSDQGQPYEVRGKCVSIKLQQACSVLCVQPRVDNSSVGHNWEQLVQFGVSRRWERPYVRNIVHDK
jgi:hypothetical protein